MKIHIVERKMAPGQAEASQLVSRCGNSTISLARISFWLLLERLLLAGVLRDVLVPVESVQIHDPTKRDLNRFFFDQILFFSEKNGSFTTHNRSFTTHIRSFTTHIRSFTTQNRSIPHIEAVRACKNLFLVSSINKML